MRNRSLGSTSIKGVGRVSSIPEISPNAGSTLSVLGATSAATRGAGSTLSLSTGATSGLTGSGPGKGNSGLLPTVPTSGVSVTVGAVWTDTLGASLGCPIVILRFPFLIGVTTPSSSIRLRSSVAFLSPTLSAF